jgi:ABC-type polysaccharide/polyol phosphate transport system ATPase subunit
MPKIVVDRLTIDFPIMRSRHSLRTAAIQKLSRVGGHTIDTGTRQYVRALSDVSFSLSSGDRLGLIGPNGSGKTTLIRSIAGVYEPSAGRIKVEGTCIPMFDIGIGFDEESSGYENILIRGTILGLSTKQIKAKVPEIAEFSELGDYLDLPIRTYSSGMSLRLMFAIATSLEGDIVLMDEWLAVGDASFRQKANERLRSITSSSGILILASHDHALLREVCNKGMTMEAGCITATGLIDDMLARSSAAPS